MKNAAIRSRRTSVAGFAAFLVALGDVLAKYGDGVPVTAADWTVVISTGLVAWGLMQARDHVVTSEEGGCKP